MAEKTYSKRLTPSGNSYSKAFAAAKAAGKETFMWKGKDYTTETAEERKADFKKETRKDAAKRVQKIYDKQRPWFHSEKTLKKHWPKRDKGWGGKHSTKVEHN